MDKFPELQVVHVSANVEALSAWRALAFRPPAHAIEIRNDGALADAGTARLRPF